MSLPRGGLPGPHPQSPRDAVRVGPESLARADDGWGRIVNSLIVGDVERYCVPRTIGDTYVSDDALAVHASIKASFGDA